MDTEERKPADEVESRGLAAPWHEKAFKIQILLLLTAFATAVPLYLAFANLRPVPRFPWLGPFIKWFMAIAGPIACGGLAIQMFRHLLWLFGRGPFVATWIGPPPRANCIMFGPVGVALGVGIESAGFAPIGVGMVVGSFCGFISLTGFLYAQAEARKSC